MTYAALGVVVLALLCVTTLGYLIYLLAKGNRSDLHALVSKTEMLAAMTIGRDDFRRSTEEKQHALTEKAAELARAARALGVAKRALAEAHEELAASGHASSVAASINSTLDQLRNLGKEKVRGVSAPETGDDSNG
jgi:hypothetical protein